MIHEFLKVINKIRDNKGLGKLEEISEDQDLMEDLGFDSLDLAELTVRCEKEFGVDIFEEEIITTVKEALDKIKNE